MTDDLARMREQLASQVVAATGISSQSVAAALRDVPRHLFLPALEPEAAYRDDAIVTKRDAAGQPISSSSQPAIMAVMLYQLGLAPGQRILEIGAGTGYNAALISHIVGPSGQVTSIDIDPELVGLARGHLASAGYGDVIVACADGAGGYPPHAPYDRIIATVGVSDLAPAWLEQAAPGARIVVPLDVRGIQVSAAFERAGPGRPGGPWTSRSLVPCGFMRMRGSLAGPERVVPLPPGLLLLLPDGTLPGAAGPGAAGPGADGPGADGPGADGPGADGPGIDAGAVAALLAGPSVPHPTGVQAESEQVLWGLGLWLAAREPRSCRLDEELPVERCGTAPGRLAGAPLRAPGRRSTVGLLDRGGVALLTADRPAADRPAAGGSGLLTLRVAGFGPEGARLAADLAAHVQAWDQAGRPGVAGLHVDAYPRSSPGQPQPPGGALIMERPASRFAVYHASLEP